MVTNADAPAVGSNTNGSEYMDQTPAANGSGNNSSLFIAPTTTSTTLDDISRQIEQVLAERSKLTSFFQDLDTKLSGLQATQAAFLQKKSASDEPKHY